MSVEEFHSMTIPWKGPDGVEEQAEVLLKKKLNFGEFSSILKKGGFDLAKQTITDLQAFMITILQFSIHKAPFDHRKVDNILALDTPIAMKIFSEALSALPLAELSQDFGIKVPDSLLNQ